MPVPCNRCGGPLPKWEAASQEWTQCTSCGASSLVRVFPALFVTQSGPVADEGAGQGEAACFDHPAKRAVAACGYCGRFVCQLCVVEFKGGTWCPTCFAAGHFAAADPNADLTQSRTLYDSIALTAAVAPLVLWPLTAFSAPVALFVALRYWRRPLSLVRRWPWRSALAILIALVEMAGWTWGVSYFLGRSGI